MGMPAWQRAWEGLPSMRNDLCTPAASLPPIADAWALHVSFVFNLPPSWMNGNPALPSETRTLPRGCLDIKNSRAARSDLSTILDEQMTQQEPLGIRRSMMGMDG